jgi:hypothetical protein
MVGSQNVRVAVVILVALAACGGDDDTASRPTDDQPVDTTTAITTDVVATEVAATAEAEWETECPGPEVRVIYRVGGTAASGGYKAAIPEEMHEGEFTAGDSEKADQVVHEFCTADDLRFIGVFNTSDAGLVSCEIEIDGDIVTTRQSSEGPSTVANCSG